MRFLFLFPMLIASTCFGVYAHSWLVGFGVICALFVVMPYTPNELGAHIAAHIAARTKRESK